MYYNILLILLLCTVFSCNNNNNNKLEEDNNNNSDSTQKMVNPIQERGNFFTPQEQTLLKKHFKKELIDSLSKNMYNFRDAETDLELEKAFVAAQTLQESLEKSLSAAVDGYKVYKSLAVLDSLMPPFVATCVAECTEFAFIFSITALRNFATTTTGKSDDSFCDLMEMASGDTGGRVGGWYNFFLRTWDYGGGTVLGNGFCLNFLEKSWNHSQRTPLFRTHLMAVRDACIQNMSHPIYMEKKEAVVAELNKILNAQVLSSEEQKKVEILKTKVDAGEENLQFDCTNGNCDFGG
jgi:hypothetical protein